MFFPCSWVGPISDRNYWQGCWTDESKNSENSKFTNQPKCILDNHYVTRGSGRPSHYISLHQSGVLRSDPLIVFNAQGKKSCRLRAVKKTAFNERAKSKSGKQNTKTPIIENVIFCDIPRLYGRICEFWMASKILQPPPPWPPSPPRTHLPWCQYPPGHRSK